MRQVGVLIHIDPLHECLLDRGKWLDTTVVVISAQAELLVATVG